MSDRPDSIWSDWFYRFFFHFLAQAYSSAPKFTQSTCERLIVGFLVMKFIVNKVEASVICPYHLCTQSTGRKTRKDPKTRKPKGSMDNNNQTGKEQLCLHVQFEILEDKLQEYLIYCFSLTI